MSDNDSSHNDPSLIHYHLGYLDEFLRLRCASDLIAMGLFPNAKEITETFAVWAALRRHILPHLSTSSTVNLPNAIIVVGDGMTPRTAALCAYLTKGLWQCYSIDPMLQYDTYVGMTFINRQSLTTIDQCNEWKNIQGLRMARTKIQTITIPCRQAIVVLMHAHVTIEDAIAAVDASEGIIGIVTCPCCKWTPYQQEWLGHAPHQQYIDLKLLSAKNQMNVWCFPQGCQSKSSMNEDKQLSIERSIWGIDTSMIGSVLSNRDGAKERAIELWPHIFANGIQAFNITDVNQSSSKNIQSIVDDLDIWPWGSTAWSPKDILPLMKSCRTTSSSSWFGKPVLLIGTIVAMRRCKHTIFYELKTCTIPSKDVEDILRPTSSMNNTVEEQTSASNDTFPRLLTTADRIWTCVEYQKHFQAVSAYDPTNVHGRTNTDRVNVVLSLSSYQRESTSPSNDHQTNVKLFNHNPQPRHSLFPWAMSLRSGDMIVTYCELGCNALQGPQLCVIDGILLFDSMLHMIGVERRILR